MPTETGSEDVSWMHNS